MSLAVPWERQIKGYYCGPATATMIAKYFGRTDATQTRLAADLGTDAAGATTWGSGKMAPTLTAWSNGRATYSAVSAPSASTFLGALRSTIGQGKAPVAVDTVENANGAHYNGHPSSKTIGHWIVGTGYTGGGGTSTYNDPATGLAGYNGATSFSIATTTMAAFARNGIVF